MARAILLRPAALADLDDIWEYTQTRFSQAQALRYFSGMNAALELLRDYPEMARARAEFAPAVRIHPYRAHLVIYTAQDAGIEVIRVLHARSDWQALLADPPP